MPDITEDVVDSAPVLPKERAQNRATYTGKVCAARHHRDGQACVDTVEFIKGLHKHNLPRSGDVLEM